MAKGIASGLPLSGILAKRELIEKWPPGTHGGTYGGNVVSCAAANATLDVINDEHLVENAAARGSQFLAGLRELATRHPAIGDVRGLGLMLALEFIKPGEGDGRVPNPDLARRVLAEALERRLIVLSAGTYANVARIIPPLVTTAAEVDLALSILDQSLAAGPAPEGARLQARGVDDLEVGAGDLVQAVEHVVVPVRVGRAADVPRPNRCRPGSCRRS